MAHSNAINIVWNYKRILCIEVAYINYLISSLNIYTDKTPVPGFGAPSAHPSIGKKLYYNGGLSLNKSIDLINIGL